MGYIERLNLELAYHKEHGMSLKGISDTYHTFEELYDFRMMYNAALFNEWSQTWFRNRKDPSAKIHWPPKYNVHKTKRHHDGELCFGGTHFKVAAMLPDGEISNHYKLKYWDLFKIPEMEKALFEYDGHTGKDVLERLINICK